MRITKPGPKPDTKKDKEVFDLREKGLSFAQIGKIMGVSKPSVFHRYNRAVRYLSTEKDLQR